MTASAATAARRFRLASCSAALLVATGCTAEVPAEYRIVGGSAEAGRTAIEEIACGICHEIPGIPGADGIVGPSLDKFGRRQLIAGVIPNRPALLQQWVRDAPSLVPDTGMPELPITEDQARDIAAYLYTLR